MTKQDEFTIGEASFITGQPVRRINRFFDEGPMKARSTSGARTIRALHTRDLVFLMVTSSEPLSHLDLEGKLKVYRYIASWWSKSESAARRTRPGRLPLGENLEINWAKVSNRVQQRAAELKRAKGIVSIDPNVRGGEPVVEGSRIPVQLVHDLIEQGMAPDEILEHYPSLTPEKIRLADVYARAYPRRGRPRRRAWHTRSS
jgi:uncharacterized protein (DUF433 family)